MNNAAVPPSKAWDWTQEKGAIWLSPSEDSYYFAERWQHAGCSRFLDLGCGRGRHALQFARRGFTVSAIDLSSVGIEELRARAETEGLAIDARVANMMELPYRDSTFDCLLAFHVISHSDTVGVRRTIAEIRRVLRPGGEFYVTLCSKEAWSFKEAGYPRIDENTVRKTDDGPEKDVPHFYADRAAMDNLFAADEIIGARHIQDLVVDCAHYVSWHYFIHGRTKKP